MPFRQRRHIHADEPFVFERVSSLTFTFTPGANGDHSISITDSLGATISGSPITYTSGTSPQTIPVSNSGLGWSPNWYINGSTYAQTNAVGATLETTFTGTSATLLVDTSILVGLGSSQTPVLAYSIDGGKETDVQLSNSGSVQTITLASSLASGSHALFVWFKNHYVNAANSYDDGAIPYSAVRVTGLQIDPSATVSNSSFSPILHVWGDSQLEAFDALAGDQAQASQDGAKSFGIMVGRAIGARTAIMGRASQGYLIEGNSGWPVFPTAFGKFSKNVSMLASGVFSPAPTYILIVEGLNDGSSSTSIQAAVQSLLAAARTAAPSAWIFHAQPFYSGLDGSANASHIVSRRSEILAAATAFAGTAATTTLADGSSYTTFATDARVAVLDCGNGFGLGFSYAGYNSGTRWTYDGLHPSQEGHAQAAARLGNLIRLAALTTGGSVFNPLGSGFIQGV